MLVEQLASDNDAHGHRKTNIFLTKKHATNVPLIVPAMMLGGSPSQPARVCSIVSRDVSSVQAIVHQVVTVATAVQEVHVFRRHISVGPRADMGSPDGLPLLCSFPLKLNDLKRMNTCSEQLALPALLHRMRAIPEWLGNSELTMQNQDR